MLKKLAKIFPIAFFVLSLGLLLKTTYFFPNSNFTLKAQTTCPYPQCESGGSCFNEGETSCNTQQCKRYTCSGGQWVNGVSDSSCGDCTQPAECGNGRCEAGETCVNCSVDCLECPTGWCEGSCNQSGCSNEGEDCPSTHTAVCRGYTGSACNQNHETFFANSYNFSEEYWCTSIQNDSGADNGAYSIVYIGDDGDYCYTYCNGNGRPDCMDINSFSCTGEYNNPSELDWDCKEEKIIPPSANFSAVCYPADQEYNDLSYRFSLNNITGSGEFQQATLFLSFNSINQTAEQESAIKGFLGKPTWPDGSWYGYWLDRQFSMNEGALNFRTWDEQLLVGGDKGNQKTIDDLVNQTQTWIQQGVFPENYQYLVGASVTFDYNGTENKNESVGSKSVSLLPDACAEPPPAPQCTNIQMFPSTDPPSSTPITDFSTLEKNQEVIFQCSASPASESQLFQYRVIKLNDDNSGKASVIFYSSPSIGRSNSLAIPDSGKYFAQCTLCASETNCAEWEPIPDITVQDVAVCRTNANEQNCTNDSQCIECYGSDAVCNNKRCEIPTGEMPVD